MIKELFDYMPDSTGNDNIIITRYKGAEEVVTVPASINGVDVTSIRFDAFKDCGHVRKVIIENGIKYIGRNAFCGCSSLEEIRLPDTLTDIGERAFYGCEALKGIWLPDFIIRIPDEAFAGCSSLEKIRLPEDMCNIGFLAFSGCDSLDYIEVPAVFDMSNGFRKFLGVKDKINISQSSLSGPLKIGGLTRGDSIEFGTYPYDANFARRPVEWTVLSNTKGIITVVTKDVIDAGNWGYRMGWYNSRIRNWLNTEFFIPNFSAFEKQHVVDGYLESRLGNTVDRVFFLGIEDIEEYDRRKSDPSSNFDKKFNLVTLDTSAIYANGEDLSEYSEYISADATPYAIARGLSIFEEAGEYAWWLRSTPVYRGINPFKHAVTLSGKIYLRMNDVDGPKGIRPAMRISDEPARVSFDSEFSTFELEKKKKVAEYFLNEVTDLKAYDSSLSGYIRDSRHELALSAIASKNPDIIARIFEISGNLREREIDEYIEKASSAGKTSITAYLLDYKWKNFSNGLEFYI